MSKIECNGKTKYNSMINRRVLSIHLSDSLPESEVECQLITTAIFDDVIMLLSRSGLLQNDKICETVINYVADLKGDIEYLAKELEPEPEPDLIGSIFEKQYKQKSP